MATYQFLDIEEFEPVTVVQAKTYLKIPDSVTAQDNLIEILSTAAKEYVQRYTSRCIGEHLVAEFWDDWPANGLFRLKFGVVAELDRVEYWDGTEWVGVEPEYYSVDKISRPARVKMLSTSGYALGAGLNRIRIMYRAGVTDGSDIPQPLITCMYRLIAFWLEGGLDQDASNLEDVNMILKLYVLNR